MQDLVSAVSHSSWYDSVGCGGEIVLMSTDMETVV